MDDSPDPLGKYCLCCLWCRQMGLPSHLSPAFQNPDMPMAFTIWRSFWILLLYYLGLLPFVSIPEKFFFCFLPTIINRYQW